MRSGCSKPQFFVFGSHSALCHKLTSVTIWPVELSWRHGTRGLSAWPNQVSRLQRQCEPILSPDSTCSGYPAWEQAQSHELKSCGYHASRTSSVATLSFWAAIWPFLFLKKRNRMRFSVCSFRAPLIGALYQRCALCWECAEADDHE